MIKWAKTVRPRCLALENVGEFVTWGPLGKDGQPCPKGKGKTFARWVAQLRNLGYVVEWRELRAADYGAPTIRTRFFLVARCDGRPIVWPEPTHGKRDDRDVLRGKKQPWRSAAECIDWSLPTPSIFLSTAEGKELGLKRPLADATLKRVAKGVERFVLNSGSPFIVNTRNGERAGQQPRIRGIDEPTWTVTAAGSQGAICVPTLRRVETLAHMEQANTGLVGHSVLSPVSTIIGKGSTQRLVETTVEHASEADQERAAAVHRFLKAHLGECSNTVMIRGEKYLIVDIGLRMLTPRELFNAQGFPSSYIIDKGANGRTLPKDAQVRACGNSVCPPLSKAIVEANVGKLLRFEREQIAA